MGWPEIGALLRTARERHGFSQSRLGDEVGCGRATVSNVEAGVRGVSVELLGRIARALELTPEECAELLDLAAGAAVAAVDEVVGG